MAEKKIVANFQIEAQSAKQELESLRTAEEKFIQGGNTLATDLTQNFGEIEQAVGKMFAKLDDGGKVSQGQFDSLIAKLGATKEAIEESGVALEDLPDEFKKALDSAEKQVKALSGAMDAAAKRTDNLKDEFGKAAKEADALAQKTKTAGEKIADSARNADAAFEKFSKTLIDNPKEGLEQLPRVAGAVIQLRQEIERAQKAGGPVDPADIARLKQFEDRLEGAKNEARTLKIEIDKATAGVNDAGQAWQGFDKVINDVANRFGTVGTGVVAGTAALAAGWAVGHKVAEAIGTDFSTAEKAAGNFEKSIASVTRAVTTDGFVAGLQQLQAVLKNLPDDLLSSGSAMEGFNALVNEGVDRAEALKVPMNDLVTIGQQHALAVQGGTDALMLFNGTLANSDPEEWASRLAALTKQFEYLRDRNKEATTEQANYKAAIEASVSAIDGYIKKLEEERIARESGKASLDVEIQARQALMTALKEASDAEALATKVKGGLSESMQTELELIEKSLPAWESNRTEVEKLTEALKKDIELYKQGMSPEREKELQGLADKIAKYGELDPVQRGEVQRQIEIALRTREAAEATKEQAGAIEQVNGVWTNVKETTEAGSVAVDKANRTISNTGEVAKTAAPEVGKLGTAMQTVETAAIKLGESKGTFTEFSDAIKNGGANIGDYAAQIDTLTSKMTTLATEAKKAAEALREVSKAADEDSTEGGFTGKGDGDGFGGHGASGSY